MPPASAAPHSSPRNYIARVWASGGGYIDGVDLSFSPLSNAICGSHGTGKSTILTFLRYARALPVPPERGARGLPPRDQPRTRSRLRRAHRRGRCSLRALARRR